MTQNEIQHETQNNASNQDVVVKDLYKSFGGQPVLSGLSLTFTYGRSYCIMGPSGVGKTTLFRLLMGLDKPDSGEITGVSCRRFSAVFQEDRLLEGYNVLENIRFACGRQLTKAALKEAARRLLPESALEKPVCEYSGGMKRRAAILRAVLTPADIVVMDEPFAGLDAETKTAAIELIRETCRGKLLLIATHDEDDAGLLGAKTLYLPCTCAR